MNTRTILLITTGTLFMAPSAWAQSSSLMAQRFQEVEETGDPVVGEENHRLRSMSMFAIAPPEPREFVVHDLVEIIVRETSRAKSKHGLETEKDYSIDGGIRAWPDLDPWSILQLQLQASENENPPLLDVEMNKSFEGEGDYERQDDLTARLTAEVIEVLPNGNLVLEARTDITNDDERLKMRLTGVCRPDDISAANTILSNQIHDLKIEKTHEGELKKANKPGILSKLLDAFFAF